MYFDAQHVELLEASQKKKKNIETSLSNVPLIIITALQLHLLFNVGNLSDTGKLKKYHDFKCNLHASTL